MNAKTVQVIGGGFSGLVSAYYLSKKGFQVVLHEKQNNFGGVIQTHSTELGPVETAANGFLRTQALLEISADIGCTLIETLPKSRRRYFFRDGKLSRFPLRLTELPGFLWKIFLLAFKRDLKPRTKESMLTWGERNFGKAAAQHIVATALNGIYSCEANQLSAELIVGPYFAKKSGAKVKAGTVAPYAGMGDFIKNLQAHLLRNGVEFRTAVVSAEQIAQWQVQKQPVVVATGAKVSQKLIQKVDPSAANLLSQVRTMPLISVHVFFTEPCAQIDGFGVLADQSAQLKVLGVLANNKIFSNRGPGYSETWIFGGTRSPQVIEYSDAEIMNLIEQESAVLFKHKRHIKASYISRWADVLPCYDLALKQALETLKLPVGVYLIGNYTGRIGLSKILEQAQNLANEVADDFAKNRAFAGQRGHPQIDAQI